MPTRANPTELIMPPAAEALSLSGLVAGCFPHGWRPSTSHYHYSEHERWPTFLVPIATVEPPKLADSADGIDQDRLRSLARGIAAGVALPPIGVGVRPLSMQFLLRVSEGVLRFHLSRELAFTQIPAYFADES